MNQVITYNDERVIRLQQKLRETLKELEQILKNTTPSLNRHRYLTDAELAKYLKLSRRTLLEYRNAGILTYYQIGGKILYRESDIEELLEKNEQEALK